MRYFAIAANTQFFEGPGPTIALELVGGIGADLYKLARGYGAVPAVWIGIHLVVIATGVMAVRRAHPPAPGSAIT